MTEKPIIFSAPMVKALLEGRKSQTRRVLKPQPFPVGGPFYRPHPQTSPREWHSVSERGITVNIQTVPYAVGDLLWVREAHYVWSSGYKDGSGKRISYRATEPDAPCGGWTASIHMPRWASRITLRVTEVRVQRLQEISEEDARAEGCPGRMGPNPDFPDEWDPSPTEEFRNLWASLHGPGSWEANPWCCAVAFERLK